VERRNRHVDPPCYSMNANESSRSGLLAASQLIELRSCNLAVLLRTGLLGAQSL
jgi:hypothetical protein